ncbi:MAG: type II secretion system F family protein, partial [Planctomycetes bacterium]|nr:type II secretion system F family protein [Planctomycetota bacterium]
MIPEPTTLFIVLGVVVGIVMLVALLFGARANSVAERLKDVSASNGAHLGTQGESGLTGLGETPFDRATKRRLLQEEKKQRRRERLVQAGFYGGTAGKVFFVTRLIMIGSGTAMGFLVSTVGQLTLTQGLLAGTVCGVVATLAPSFWLDQRKRRRQLQLRRALPDALDVLVVCLQGGLSVMAAFSRVASELTVAHPMLAVEVKIAERQMQMGQSAGDSIRGIADRFDLEELRSMSSVLKQAERVGSSVATALEVFAETLRMKRQQRAEEQAQKASVKMLIPTLLCIFPAIFVVILGPAGIQVYNTLIMGVM